MKRAFFGGSPLSRLRSVVGPTMAPRATSSRAVGVQLLVAFFLQCQLQKQHRQQCKVVACFSISSWTRKKINVLTQIHNRIMDFTNPRNNITTRYTLSNDFRKFARLSGSYLFTV